MSETSSFFYALSVPKGVQVPDSVTDLVFQDRSLALVSLKLLKGSQLRRFDTREEAERYSREPLADVEGSGVREDGAEKLTVASFRSIAPRDLVPLRRSIEKGDTDAVKDMIRSNPRFLISSGDSAVILMAGPRYNACHLAAKADKGQTLELILQTVSDPEFVRRLYVSDDEETTSSRCRVLLDCYLNTPDQGAHDTPLHFACKFGSVSCVKIILSYTQCDRTKINKSLKTAQQVICERKCDAWAKAQIELLFEPQLFIPVIRTDELIRVGRPEDHTKLEEESNVQAVAGPLSPPQAKHLFQYLRSPHRKGSSADVRLSDQTKGVERMARTKCREMGVEWTEWWPFLDCKVDLSSPRGLRLLEHHLKQKQLSRDSCQSFDMTALSRALEELHVCQDSDGEDEVYYTAPSSPSDPPVFVQGSGYTIWDRNAFLALDGADIDQKTLPLVARWYDTVSEMIKDPSNQVVTPLKNVNRFAAATRLAFTP